MEPEIDLDIRIQSYLITNTPELSTLPTELVQSILHKSLSLITVVKGLGSTLTSESDEDRARGTSSSFLCHRIE